MRLVCLHVCNSVAVWFKVLSENKFHIPLGLVSSKTQYGNSSVWHFFFLTLEIFSAYPHIAKLFSVSIVGHLLLKC